MKKAFIIKSSVAFLAVALLAYYSHWIYAVVLGGVFVFWFERSYLKPLESISQMTQQMTHQITQNQVSGDFQKIYQEDDSFQSLSEPINDLALTLKNKIDEAETEQKKLKAVLDGMTEGVLVTNARAEVVLYNPAFQKIFEVDSGIGKSVIECIRNKELFETIQNVLASQITDERELTLNIDFEERHLRVRSARLTSDDEVVGSVSVFSDMTEIKKLENMRREFVANVSHELKTPLTNILGYSETLQKGVSQPEMMARFHEKISKNARVLQMLVEDILNLSEIENGQRLFVKEAVSLHELAGSLEESFEDFLKQKKMSFHNDVPVSLTLMTDPNALRQILVNLVDNAIKYTPEGGKITISAALQENGVTVMVQDTGIGIPEEDLSRIFERFYRVDKARARSTGGTGLGLSIVKHLAQNLGAEISVSSQLESGTRFRLFFVY